MYKKVGAAYKKALDILIITMFTVMFLITVVNVFARFILNSPITWSAELARYTFIWIIFLGAALAVRNGSHIGMEVVMSKLPQKGKAFLKATISCLSILFLCAFVFVGFQQAVKGLNTESAAMQIPMLIPYLALPIGGIAMIIEMIKVMKRKDNDENNTQEII